MKKSLSFILLLITFIVATGFSLPNKIALHYSESTEILDDKLIDKFTYWEIFLINNKISYDVIYDNDLESGFTAKDYRLIIFPSTIALSEKAFDALIKFTNNSGSVIAFGEFLIYNEKMINIGWERFESFFGARFAGRIPENKMSVLLDLADYSPFSNSVNKLKELRVTAKNSPLIVEPLANNSRSIARFNFNQPSSKESDGSAIMQVNGGSFKIWFSLGATEIIGGKEDINAYEQFILNAIETLRRDDIIWFESIWNKKQPVVLMFDLTRNIKQTKEIIKIVDEQNLSPGFIISENEVESEYLKSLSKKGEIIVSLSSETVKTASTSLQDDDIISDKLTLFSKITGKGISSVYADGDLLDYNIIRILKRNGIRNLFTSSLAVYSDKLEGLSTIHISTTNNFKFKNISNISKDLTSQQFYLHKLNRLRFTEKIPILIYTAYANCKENEIQNFGNFLKSLDQTGNNFIPIDGFLKWSEIKEGLQVSITRIDKKTLQINLKNRSNSNIEKLKLCISSGIFEKNDSVSIIIPGQDVDFIYNSNTSFVEIFLDNVGRQRELKIEAKVK